MKWSIRELTQNRNKEVHFNEELEFTKKDFATIERLRKVNSINVDGSWFYNEHEGRVYADIHVTGEAIVACSITLEDLPLEIDISTSEIFSFEEDDESADYFIDDNIVDLMPIVEQLIVMAIPMKFAKEGVEYPSGKDWEVLSEEDLIYEEDDSIDPRLAKLLEFEVESD